MSKVFPTVNTTADTWAVLIARVNSLIGTLATETVTANSSPDGAITIGNTFVSGIIGGTVLTANTIRGGYPNVSAPLVVGSNLVMNTTFSIVSGGVVANSTTLAVGANVIVNTSTITVGTTTINATALTYGNATVNSTAVWVGNSTVNAYVNSTAVLVQNASSHALLTPDRIFLGNTGTSTTITSAGIPPGGIQSISFGDAVANLTANVLMLKIANSLSTATLEPSRLTIGASQVNATAISVGATLINTQAITTTGFISVGPTVINTQAISVGATVINAIAFSVGTTSINTTAIYTSGMILGNTTANSFMNSVMVSVANSGGQANLEPNRLSVANVSLVKIIWSDGTTQSGGGFVVGTRLMFPQASVPVGWTKFTSQNDYAIRLVSSTGGGTGGVYSFSTVFSRTATDGFGLTEYYNGYHQHAPIYSNYYYLFNPGGAGMNMTAGGDYAGYLPYDLLSHTPASGSGGSHAHGMDMRVAYLDTLIGIKA